MKQIANATGKNILLHKMNKLNVKADVPDLRFTYKLSSEFHVILVEGVDSLIIIIPVMRSKIDPAMMDW